MARVFGWTPERALQAATSRASRALGLEQKLGRIAAGQLADFVVMRGRPWQELSDLDTANIVAVVSKGELVSGELPR